MKKLRNTFIKLHIPNSSGLNSGDVVYVVCHDVGSVLQKCDRKGAIVLLKSQPQLKMNVVESAEEVVSLINKTKGDLYG